MARNSRSRTRLASGIRAVAITLVIVGTGISLLASWYLWGTGWLTAQNQDRLEVEFQDRLLGIHDATALPLDDGAREEAATITAEVEWDVPVVAFRPAGTPVLSLENLEDITTEEAPAPGEPTGRITIEKIDLDWIFVEGVEPRELALGPGHMPDTPLPGQPGNAVISGHRTTNGAPFYSLDELEPGDLIEVTTLTGVHTYEVIDTRIVDPSEWWVTTQWEGGWLTLTTCTPLYSSRQRLIVFSQLVDGPNAAIIHGRWGIATEVPAS